MKKENSGLADKLTKHEVKVKDDCNLILHQIELLKDSNGHLKLHKESLRQHQKHSRKVEGLLRTALNVKLHYEEVILCLVRNPLTDSITKYLLSKTPKKEFTLAELSLAVKFSKDGKSTAGKKRDAMRKKAEYVSSSSKKLQTRSLTPPRLMSA